MHFKKGEISAHSVVQEDEREYLSESSDKNESEPEAIEEKYVYQHKIKSAENSDNDDYHSVGGKEASVKISLFQTTQVDFKLTDIFHNRVYMINLIIIILSWSASTFCFYITSFYIKYLPGDVYMNIIILCIADALSSIGAGVMSTAFGAKRTLFLSFLLSSIGGLALIFAG